MIDDPCLCHSSRGRGVVFLDPSWIIIIFVSYSSFCSTRCYPLFAFEAIPTLRAIPCIPLTSLPCFLITLRCCAAVRNYEYEPRSSDGPTSARRTWEMTCASHVEHRRAVNEQTRREPRRPSRSVCRSNFFALCVCYEAALDQLPVHAQPFIHSRPRTRGWPQIT